MNQHDADFIDNDSRQRTEKLAQKVSQLKNFAVDIEVETKEHNRLLNSVSGNFESIFGSITGSKTRILRFLESRRSNRAFLCYLSLGLTTFFIFSYYLITRTMSSVSF